MVMKPTREESFIKLLLSVYENGLWADASLEKPDAIDRKNPAVDQVATRKCDGKRLAIEHTIIEPFVGDKEDFALFQKSLLGIEKDESLLVPGRWIQVFVPVGTLQNRPQRSRDTIVQSVHRWIESTRLVLPDGISAHPLSIVLLSGQPLLDITLTVKVTPLRGGPVADRGSLHVRRQPVGNSLGDVVMKALKRKLPKLVNTAADKRILLLERQHMNLVPEHILGEIEKLRASFLNLAGVHEVWFIETILYGTAFGGTYLRFELYESGHIVRSYDFVDGKLMDKVEDGVAEVIRKVGDSSL